MQQQAYIICVDDENVVLRGLESQLGRHFGKQYIIELAESAEEGLEIIEELLEEGCKVPVVISDQIMPGLKGHEFLFQLHQISSGTRKILLTGQADAAAVGDAVNRSALYRYISKPWESDDLVLTVKEALKSYQAEQELEEKNRELEAYSRDLERKVSERTDDLQATNDRLNTTNEELRTTLDLVNDQKTKLQIQHDNITASVNYASRIQRAVMPDNDYLENIFGEANFLVLNRPRDTVSGDFYWIDLTENNLVIAVADCTGHGVPGSFMSLLGIQCLHEIRRRERREPAQILGELNDRIRQTLHQEKTNSRDGMDIALLRFNLKTKTTTYAGARRPLLLQNPGEELQVFEADKRSVGGDDCVDCQFAEHEIPATPDSIFYLFSDGFQDQFGGPKSKKIMKKFFYRYLTEISERPMREQEDQLDQKLNKWMSESSEAQTDDVLVMGFRLSRFLTN